MRLDITHAKVEPDEVADLVEKLEPYTKHLQEVSEATNFEALEASVNLPSDLAQHEVVSALHKELETENLKYIFLIGIGGSNLGVKAVYDAVIGYRDVVTSEAKPKIIFIDTNETVLLEGVQDIINNELGSLDEFLVVTISKSGGTTETILNTEIILTTLHEKFGESVFERAVGITGEDSAYEEALKEKNIRILYIPDKVGGRYSVFSPVGLFPLLSAHIDIDSLLAGALSMRQECLGADFSSNLALQSAIVLFLQSTKGNNINTNFVFRPQLESLGKWYRQLLAESIGKRDDVSGNTVYSGITPEVSIGSTDLHSMAQLYLGGPRDKITTFITTENLEGGIDMPKSRLFSSIVPDINDKGSEEVMQAIYQGVKRAYEKSDRPYAEVVLEDLSPYELGAFMQFKMLEMMYLGKLFNVNPFNQPNVEEYKTETKNILKET